MPAAVSYKTLHVFGVLAGLLYVQRREFTVSYVYLFKPITQYTV